MAALDAAAKIFEMTGKRMGQTLTASTKDRPPSRVSGSHKDKGHGRGNWRFKRKHGVGRHAGEECAGTNARKTGTSKRLGWQKRRQTESGEDERMVRDVLDGSENLCREFSESRSERAKQRAVFTSVACIEIGDCILDGVFEQDGCSIVERVGARRGGFNPEDVDWQRSEEWARKPHWVG